MTGEASVGGMMGQAFSLRVLFRPQPRAAAAKAALPWARMDEAVGLAGKAEGLAGMKAAGLQSGVRCPGMDVRWRGMGGGRKVES